MRIFLRFIGWLAFCLLVGGCGTPGQDDSDLPWNTPQPWESAPTIPGLNNR